MTKIHIELQKYTKEKHGRPHKSEFKRWLEAVIETLQSNDDWQQHLSTNEPYEMTVRTVEETESIQLNSHSRGISKPTNVLSFPFESPNTEMDHYLGDMALCGPVIEAEARQSRIDIKEYWAHMFIHGSLHLFGFDHVSDEQAERMQSVENTVMQRLHFAVPYPELL